MWTRRSLRAALLLSCWILGAFGFSACRFNLWSRHGNIRRFHRWGFCCRFTLSRKWLLLRRYQQTMQRSRQTSVFREASARTSRQRNVRMHRPEHAPVLGHRDLATSAAPETHCYQPSLNLTVTSLCNRHQGFKQQPGQAFTRWRSTESAWPAAAGGSWCWCAPIADSSGPGISSAMSRASCRAFSTMSKERITPSRF
jgi:hypothetical protein